uniref:Class II aldolase/adducin N-terminal domain-containing protein n=1 Tax=Acrobeloides nanus TaxID=290746 RepID=A0A914C2E1_9BILA
MGATDDEDISPETFVKLMNQFYHLGWVYGSSGGMAVCSKNVIYYSPSSVNKERLKESDLFVFNSENNELVRRPENPKIKESACTPLFNLVLNDTDALCVIHTHAKFSNLLTQLIKGGQFEIANQEMIKGIMNRKTWKAYANVDKLIVPIVDNEPEEYMLLPALKKTLEGYPETCAVLVRNHGLFVWGNTWQKTKIMLECYEYLFELACDMIQRGLPLV